ncbi:MAG TPA: aldose epimerase family protein [Pelobium sp.]
MLKDLDEAFKKTINGKQVGIYWLKNDEVRVGICNYGARITHYIVANGAAALDIVLGFDSIDEYLDKENEFYYGVTVGRFANRIEDAKFSLNGKTYHLEANNGGNSLHSGSIAFHNRAWDVEQANENQVNLSIFSTDGEGGFPGNLSCEVIFTLTEENELIINYSAKSDEDTVVNLTNHSYFNLNGAGNGTILNHQIRINANEFVPIKENCIPKGNFETVAGTPFDFLEAKTVERDLNQQNEQLKFGNGYDHSFAINQNELLNFAAAAKGDKTGLTLEVYTTQPGMQFYTGNYLNGHRGKLGGKYSAQTGFCFETQHHPDSPNQAAFPSTVLKKDATFKSTTVFKIV